MAATMKGAVGRLSNIFRCYNHSFYGQSCRQISQQANELIEDVKYPDIVPKYPPGRWSDDIPPRRAWEFNEEAKRLREIRDVRERLESIAGEKERLMFLARCFDTAKRTLPFKQFITRTHIIHNLPELYESMDVSETYKRLKPAIENVILLENEYRLKQRVELKRIHRRYVQNYHSTELLGAILNIVISGCAINNQHLLMSQLGKRVRVETFWRVAGYDNSYDTPIGRAWMQYKEEAAYQIRTELPLPEYLPVDHELCVNGEVPVCKIHPKAFGQKVFESRPITVSGHWIGDPCEFTHLTCQVPSNRYEAFYGNLEDQPDMANIIDEAWLGCGLISSFASCVSQAHNQGFNMYDDVAYPFTTQAIVCYQNNIQFFTYQLNTFKLWLHREDHPVNNILWASSKQKLYDTVENGQIKGFNDETFKQLLKFVLLKSADRGYNLRPHLSSDDAPVNKEKFINNIGEEKIEVPKIGRWQYPKNAVYF